MNNDTMGRREGEGAPNVTYLLQVVLLVIQLYLSFLPVDEATSIFEALALYPTKLFGGDIKGLFTHMFLHASWSHLLANMIALWGAGVIVERDMGSAKFGAVYLFSGIVAGLAHSLLFPASDVPTVGASGAIFGVIALLFLLMPFKVTFMLLVPMPAVLVGLILIAVEASSFLVANDVGIAHDAHLAGFIFGGVSAFIIDEKRAFKGLLVAVAVALLIYVIGSYFGYI